MPFEPDIPGYMSGGIRTTVQDPAGLQPHTHIIRLSDAWAIRVQWDISGGGVSGLAPTALWHVRAYLESIGPGNEFEVATLDEPLGAAAPSHSYDKVLAVPAAHPLLAAGPYKLVTVITITNGGVPVQIAAYDEGPVLQFYQFP